MGTYLRDHSKHASSWLKFTFYEQMASIGVELARAVRYSERHPDYKTNTQFHKVLELIDLTIEIAVEEKQHSRVRELLLARDTIVDYFVGSNEFDIDMDKTIKSFEMFAFHPLNPRYSAYYQQKRAELLEQIAQKKILEQNPQEK